MSRLVLVDTATGTLWITTGLLLCLLVAILTAMLMAARAVVA